MNRPICDDKKLNKKKLAFDTYNILRKLGIKTSNQGAKLIYLAIIILANSDMEFIKLENIYEQISKQIKSMNKFQIRRSIQYAIDSRDIKKCEKNFEMVFGYEYDKNIFTNKNFIDELIRFI